MTDLYIKVFPCPAFISTITCHCFFGAGVYTRYKQFLAKDKGILKRIIKVSYKPRICLRRDFVKVMYNYCQWILSWIRYFYAVIFVLKIKYVDSMQVYLLCNLKSDFEIQNVYNHELNLVVELIYAYCM